MNLFRTVILFVFVCIPGFAGCRATKDSGQESLEHACEFLLQQQGEDGGWHSQVSGLAKSGQAYTAFILYALLEVPAGIYRPPQQAVQQALSFMRRQINADGVLGMADPDLPEYPNYATAYALRCFVRAGADTDSALIKRMRAYLVSEQFREEMGFDPESPAYGGWGFGGLRPEGSPGHMELAHTRSVLEALREAGEDNAAMRKRSEVFLHIVQRHPDDSRPQPPYTEANAAARSRIPYDGGFYLSPIVVAANKAGLEPAHEDRPSYYRSYATATCDGLLALIAAGVTMDDERIVAARDWLRRHPRLDYPEGISPDQHENWGESIHFYHLAARARLYARLDWPGDWRDEIVRILVPQQREDGSFKNMMSHLMKEDDPLLATALSLVALSNALR